MQKRHHFTHTTSLGERLAEDAKHLREIARMLPHGPTRDAVLLKIRQDEVASHINGWLNSPGLRAPK